MAWTAVSLGVVAPIIELVPVGSVVRALTAVLFICLGPGSAVVCRFRLGAGVAAWALTLATMAATAALMAWLSWWYPMVGFDLIAVLITAACLPLLVRRRWWLEPERPAAGPPDATMLLPRIVDALPDSTIVMPRIPGEPTPTETAVLPVIREDDDWSSAPWRRSPDMRPRRLPAGSAAGAVGTGVVTGVWHTHRRTFPELTEQLRGSGVGLTAMLTAAVVRDPRHVIGLLRVSVPALRSLLGRDGKTKTAARPAGYPSDPTRAELRGMLRGPAAYATAWRRIHRWRG